MLRVVVIDARYHVRKRLDSVRTGPLTLVSVCVVNSMSIAVLAKYVSLQVALQHVIGVEVVTRT